MVSCPRRVLRNVSVHDSNVVILVLNPIRYTRCSTSQISQAMKPLNSRGPILATAENRDTVAMEPLSKYWNGLRSAGAAPARSALIVFAPDLAPRVATSPPPRTPPPAPPPPPPHTSPCPRTSTSGHT